ncbi:hypothetical protein IID24_00100 [Patescibacteria group bacterium]|nr:hypothetical protein [Patescibacteria group bacterium]
MYDATHGFKIFEVIMPQDVVRPLKAMEAVFASLWQLYDPPNKREYWFEGQYQQNLSIEIVSTEGVVHFYLRFPEGNYQLIEAAVYSQYPDAELREVEDYTKKFPQDIPNKDWEFWGASYKLYKPDVYPIKTYSKFFELSPDIKEEKRLNPMSLFVEAASKIGKGEHIWIQFVCEPITIVQDDYIARGKQVVDELISRPEKEKPPSAVSDIHKVGHMLATGQEVGIQEEEQREFIPPEFKLTPGEREVVSSIEEKISKSMFRVHSRFLYIAKREIYFSPTKALPLTFYSQFQTSNLNAFTPLFTTKVHTILFWFLDSRRRFLKKRRMFRNYTLRFPPYFPRNPGVGEMFILNIEELATIFHFPGRITAPATTAPRLAAKKGEAPLELPTQ